ncbi:MAG: hypothetical protein J5829_09255 [Lachnospiraceae bacterium]|nr:hypothetical protein [Lachnospiraceae bacterium]
MISQFGKRREYRFTSKSRSPKGIMSTVCAGISVAGLVAVLAKVIKNGGQAGERMGAAGFVAFVFCFAGLALGILALMEKDKFEFFPRLGFILSVLSAVAWSFVLYAGLLAGL